MVTPREIIRDFLTLLNILRDNPTATFEGILKSVSFKRDPDDSDDTPQGEVRSAKNKVSLFDIDI